MLVSGDAVWLEGSRGKITAAYHACFITKLDRQAFLSAGNRSSTKKEKNTKKNHVTTDLDL